MLTVAGPHRREAMSIRAITRPAITAGILDPRHRTGASAIAGVRRPATAPASGRTGGVSPLQTAIEVKPLMAVCGASVSIYGHASRPQAGLPHVSSVFRTPQVMPLLVSAITSFGMIPSSILSAPGIRVAGYFVLSLSGRARAPLRTAPIRRSMSRITCLADLGAATKTKAPHSVTIRTRRGRAPRRSYAKCSVLLIPKATLCDLGKNG